MQKGEGHMDVTERGRTCGQCREWKDVPMMQRGEGQPDNGLDSRHVDVVDDDRGILVQEPKQPEYYTTCKRNAKFIQQHSRTRTGSGSASNMNSSTPDAQDNTNWVMQRGEYMVLVMVLREDVLALLMMVLIKYPPVSDARDNTINNNYYDCCC